MAECARRKEREKHSVFCMLKRPRVPSCWIGTKRAMLSAAVSAFSQTVQEAINAKSSAA